MRFVPLTALSLSAALSAGCAIDPGRYQDACDWAAPIRPSRSDVLSLETRRQIVAHNEIGAGLCGWQP